MKSSKEQKFFIFLLVFYWLGIFVATHIPAPNWTGKMGMSDKTMHFAAYSILTFLLWFSLSFEQKANWKQLRPWLLSAIVLLYGVVDELLQHFVKRSVDLGDFAADASGLAAAMAAITLLPGYHAVMIPVTICTFLMPAIVRAQLIPPDSLIEGCAYLAGFAIVTLAWVKYLSSICNLDPRRLKYVPLFFAGPAGAAAILKFYAVLTNKPFGTKAFLITLISIILTLFIRHLAGRKNDAI